jgi:hypothetical protein
MMMKTPDERRPHVKAMLQEITVMALDDPNAYWFLVDYNDALEYANELKRFVESIANGEIGSLRYARLLAQAKLNDAPHSDD